MVKAGLKVTNIGFPVEKEKKKKTILIKMEAGDRAISMWVRHLKLAKCRTSLLLFGEVKDNARS